MGRLDHHFSVGAHKVNMRDWGWFCAECHPHTHSGHCLCSRERRFPGRGSAFEVARSNGVGRGSCWQENWFFFPITGGSFAYSKAVRDGGGEGVLPHQAAAALSLSAQAQSFSSPASPVNLASGANTSYLRVPRRAGSNTWEQFKGAVLTAGGTVVTALPCQLPPGPLLWGLGSPSWCCH